MCVRERKRERAREREQERERDAKQPIAKGNECEGRYGWFAESTYE